MLIDQVRDSSARAVVQLQPGERRLRFNFSLEP